MRRLEFVLTVTPGLFVPFAPVTTQSNEYILNDSHFHLTNYIQEGTNIHDFLKIMGEGRPFDLVRHSSSAAWSYPMMVTALRRTI